ARWARSSGIFFWVAVASAELHLSWAKSAALAAGSRVSRCAWSNSADGRLRKRSRIALTLIFCEMPSAKVAAAWTSVFGACTTDCGSLLKRGRRASKAARPPSSVLAGLLVSVLAEGVLALCLLTWDLEEKTATIRRQGRPARKPKPA